MEKQTNLKPCPFCGGKVKESSENYLNLFKFSKIIETVEKRSESEEVKIKLTFNDLTLEQFKEIVHGDFSELPARQVVFTQDNSTRRTLSWEVEV